MLKDFGVMAMLLAIVLATVAIVRILFPIPAYPASNLDPAPGQYTWTRVNPEPSLTCLIVEAQYNTHPIAMWCERMEP